MPVSVVRFGLVGPNPLGHLNIVRDETIKNSSEFFISKKANGIPRFKTNTFDFGESRVQLDFIQRL